MGARVQRSRALHGGVKAPGWTRPMGGARCQLPLASYLWSNLFFVKEARSRAGGRLAEAGGSSGGAAAGCFVLSYF